MAAAAYRFIPWSRRGLSAAITSPDQGQALPSRPGFEAGLTVSNVAPNSAKGVTLSLYGPGDVIGLDPRVIIRAEPKPHTTDTEPNYLAFVEFDLPELPWMFSPAAPAQERLRPWLALVVLETRGPDAVALPTTTRERPLPFISLTTAQVTAQLPDLSESWAWAHGQLIVEKDAAVAMPAALAGDPDLSLSRLICPRRLEPMTSYMACLVPAFDVGVLRGLGGMPAAGALAHPAWRRDQPAAMELPVFYHWEFATGPDGDFESLARLLKPFKSPPQFGTVPMYVWDAIPDLDAKTPAAIKAKPVLMNGALRASEQGPAKLSDIDQAFQDAIAGEVNAPADIADASAPGSTQAIAAPIYGGLHVRQARVSGGLPLWLRDLNLDPRARAAAGIAAEVVRENQEDFMQACWQQVGDVLRAQMLLNTAALATEALSKLHATLMKLPHAELLALAAPALIRLPYEGLTIASKVARTSLPDASFSAGFRRMAATRSAMVRHAARTMNLASSKVALVEAMAPGIAMAEPNAFIPDGIATLRAFEALATPADAGTMVDLGPIGLETMTAAGKLAGLKAMSVKLGATVGGSVGGGSVGGGVVGGGSGFDGIGIGSGVTRSGMIGELQIGAAAVLVDEGLEDAAVTRPLGLHQVLDTLSAGAGAAPQAEGFLLELGSDGAPAIAALDVDAGGRIVVRSRGGQREVGAIGRQLQAGGREAMVRALSDLPAGMLAGEGAGNRALAFHLDRGDGGMLRMEEAVVSRGGRQTFRARGKQGRTKTVGELVKDTGTIGRLIDAYRDLGRNFGRGVQVGQPTAVPFDIAKAAAAARQRLEPRASVASRVESMVSVGGKTLAPGAVAASGIEQLVYASTAKDRILCAPRIIEPAYKRLAKYDQEAFVPGIGTIPQNSMSLLETNSRFVEAFMVGLNHEMNRELLWRSYPTDQRGTVFRHFWDWDDGGPDIPPIHQFAPGKPLGGNSRGGEQGELVLVVRGALLRRYPNSLIYAWRAEATPAGPKLKGTLNPGDPFDPAVDLQTPVFHGEFDPDVSMAGFALTDTDLDDGAGWFFVIEQQPTEPRFGFDQEKRGVGATTPSNWFDARWIDTGTLPGGSIALNGPLAGTTAQTITFGKDAAHMAALSLQRPFRVAVHASYLTSV